MTNIIKKKLHIKKELVIGLLCVLSLSLIIFSNKSEFYGMPDVEVGQVFEFQMEATENDNGTISTAEGNITIQITKICIGDNNYTISYTETYEIISTGTYASLDGVHDSSQEIGTETCANNGMVAYFIHTGCSEKIFEDTDEIGPLTYDDYHKYDKNGILDTWDDEFISESYAVHLKIWRVNDSIPSFSVFLLSIFSILGMISLIYKVNHKK